MYNQNLVFNGLGTLSVTVPAAGVYFFNGQISLPSLVNGGGQSQLVVTIKQNGSTVYTGAAGASGFQTYITCAAGDVIAMIFASGAAADQPSNVIKSVIAISQGVF